MDQTKLIVDGPPSVSLSLTSLVSLFDGDFLGGPNHYARSDFQLLKPNYLSLTPLPALFLSLFSEK